MISAASPGQVIDGRYTIIKLIGRGAMADVFEARDSATQEKVAIKILRDVMSQDPDAVARFEREAQVQQRIRHPNVAVMYGAGMHGSSPYLALELLGGRSLLNVLKHEKQVPLMRAVAYGWQALQGLAATHAAGVLHRDLKPANLMLRPNGDGTERVVLIDFGFASLEGAAGITRQGFVVGSLTYMAPERLRSEPVDARADLYGLAVVLYELLAGIPPFRNDDDTTLIGEILEDAPPPLTQLVPEVPEAVDRVIAKALAKYPSERAASADEMAAELAAAVGVA
jgi:eukaryotic-like serine/threonine-protein kinase